jgi:hypothetical protein
MAGTGSLDALYGAGSSAAFREACGGETSEVPIDGGVRVYVDWEDGSTMKIDCRPDEVHFLTLVSKRKGLYTRLVESLSEVFRGIRWIAYPTDEEAEAILRKRGGWERVGSRLEWVP